MMGHGTSRGHLGSVLTLLATVIAAGSMPAAAEGDDDFHDLLERRAWTAYADARPISPYLGTPGEHAPGVPFSRSYLDSTPGRAEAFAAFYYPSEIIEEGVLETTEAYQNPTMVRVNNPDIGRGNRGELAPLGRHGPWAVAETASRTDATSEARLGLGGDGFTLAAGWGRTAARFNRDDRLVDEATSVVQGLDLGDGVRIGTLESHIRLEHRLHAEPLVSYRLLLAGVEAGGEMIVGVGAEGVTLAGRQVAAADLVEQFNAQADQFGRTFADLVARASLRLVQPRVEQRDDGSYLVTGAAVEGRSDNKPFAAGGGDHVGVRLGAVKVFAYLLSLEAP